MTKTTRRTSEMSSTINCVVFVTTVELYSTSSGRTLHRSVARFNAESRRHRSCTTAAREPLSTERRLNSNFRPRSCSNTRTIRAPSVHSFRRVHSITQPIARPPPGPPASRPSAGSSPARPRPPWRRRGGHKATHSRLCHYAPRQRTTAASSRVVDTRRRRIRSSAGARRR